MEESASDCRIEQGGFRPIKILAEGCLRQKVHEVLLTLAPRRFWLAELKLLKRFDQCGIQGKHDETACFPFEQHRNVFQIAGLEAIMKDVDRLLPASLSRKIEFGPVVGFVVARDSQRLVSPNLRVDQNPILAFSSNNCLHSLFQTKLRRPNRFVRCADAAVHIINQINSLPKVEAIDAMTLSAN